MALTFQKSALKIHGDDKALFGTFTGDASYPTGGYPVVQSTFGTAPEIQAAHHIAVGVVNNLGNRYTQYNPVTKTLQIFTALGTEATNASDQSTSVISAVVWAK